MAQNLMSLRAGRAGFTPGGRLLSKKGFVSGDNGSQFDLIDPSRVVDFDDFLGDLIADEWGVHTGSDGSAAAFAISVANGGMVRGTTGAGAGASMAANGVQLEKALNWYAANGELVFQTRIKAAAVTSLALFAGFTDQLSALEMPFTLSTGTLTSNATDAVGFLYDTAATASTWKAVGVANDVDATFQELTKGGVALAPTAATWTTLRVVINSSGAATFFVDGVQVGSQMTGAVTPSVALTPVIAGFRRSAASTTIDADYVFASMLRA